MAKFWQYCLAVIVAVLVWVGFLWALFGHKMKIKTPNCNNTMSRQSHPLIYFPKRDQCFPLYTQGPCQDRYWLAIQGLRVSCSPNTCIDHFERNKSPEDQVVVPFNNKCYTLGESCGEQGLVVVYGDSGYPNCTSSFVVFGGILPGHGGVCPMGTFLFAGSCVSNDEPDFE